MYTNALLATLNARSYLRRLRGTDSVPLSSLSSNARSQLSQTRNPVFYNINTVCPIPNKFRGSCWCYERKDASNTEHLEVNITSDSYATYNTSSDPYARKGSISWLCPHQNCNDPIYVSILFSYTPMTSQTHSRITKLADFHTLSGLVSWGRCSSLVIRRGDC